MTLVTAADVLHSCKDATDALQKALASPYLSPGELETLVGIARQLQSIEGMLELTQQAMTPEQLLNVMCAAIKDYEGWAAPGQILNGMKYSQGTPAWQNKNPGNLRCPMGARGSWNRLATGSRNNFCVFKDEATGMQAQKNVILSVAGGKAASGPYHDAAVEHGLRNTGELTLLQYMIVRDPAADSNDPQKYAKYLGERMGVDYATWQLKHLVG